MDCLLMWVERRTSRAQRLCLMCDSQLPCDECHLVFECPAVQHLRDGRFKPLFTIATLTMVQFLWQKDIRLVAQFIYEASLMLSPET